MGKKHIRFPHQRHIFYAAKMLVAFQKRPGVGEDRIIKDGGAGIFRREEEEPITINPVNGIYAIPLHQGERFF